jgi:hypothetical protein
MVWINTRQMAPENYEHHGQSGEYEFLPSGELVPAVEASKPEATKPAQPSKAKN